MIYVPKGLPRKCVAPFAYIQYLISSRGTKITTQEILYSMNYDNTQYNRKWLNESINYMLDNKIISGKLIEQNSYQFDKKHMKLEPGKYYMCEFKEIRRILSLEEGCNKIDLVGYYGILVSTISYKYKEGHCFLSVLSNMAKVSKDTISKYNKILEDNRFIYMVHSTIKGKPNYYGLYDDYDYVVRAAYKAGLWLPKNVYNKFKEYNQLN